MSGRLGVAKWIAVWLILLSFIAGLMLSVLLTPPATTITSTLRYTLTQPVTETTTETLYSTITSHKTLTETETLTETVQRTITEATTVTRTFYQYYYGDEEKLGYAGSLATSMLLTRLPHPLKVVDEYYCDWSQLIPVILIRAMIWNDGDAPVMLHVEWIWIEGPGIRGKIPWIDRYGKPYVECAAC